MDKIAIYYRVSTDRQDLASQKNTVEKWLAELPKKPSKVHVLEDEGISGKHENRPGYKQLMTMAVNRQIDTIVVYRLDRLSRNATVAIKTLLEMDEYGVGFISVTQPVLNLGHANPFRRTMLAAFAEIAEIERETIVQRVRSGLEAAKKRGTRLGAPQKISREKQIEARSLKAEGLSFKKIAERMDLSVGSVHTLVTGEDIID
ncbi:recombinase family protein [bacterium]|nr:recombinase family protein [bacterium]